MRVKIHQLFESFVASVEAKPEASLVHSMAQPPRLGDFLDALDPKLLLDWSGQSFHGVPALREKVVQRWDYAPVCSADDVLITAGTAEANFLAISNLVEAGDEMIVDIPGWPQPLVLGDAIGATVRRLPRRENQRWRIDLDELAEFISPKTRLIFICNPNNPTGHTLNKKELERVANMADRVGAWVLTDEVYRGMEWDNCPTPRMATLYERGISTGSVSKVFGLQGLRTGWLVCQDPQLIFDAMVLREDTSEIMNIMGEAIADIALDASRFENTVLESQEAGQANLDLLDQFVKQQPALSWHRPQSGFIGFCRLDLPIDADELSARLLASPYKTFVMSGAAYGFPSHIRVGAGGGEAAELSKGLERLDSLLRTLA